MGKKITMTIPTKITMIRLIMIPLVILSYCLQGLNEYVFIITALLFFIASMTDYLDGHIARKRGLVTNFGKFMDPLADKLLVCSALILLTAEGSLSPIVTLIIVAREFIISGFRLVASDNGVVIAASKWGKLKTVVQMIMCILLIFPYTYFYQDRYIFEGMRFITVGGLMGFIELLAVVLTIISLADYIAKNHRVITEGGM